LPRDSSWDATYLGFQKSATPDNPFPSNYYKWLNKHGYDDKQPRSSQFEASFELFDWMGDLDPNSLAGTDNKVRIRAIHAGCTLNKNCRSEQELRLAARSGSMRPMLLNHGRGRWKGNPVIGRWVDMEYEEMSKAVTGWGYIFDTELYKMVKNHEPPFTKGNVSIGDWSRKSPVDSKGQRHLQGMKIMEASLLTDDFAPGDPAGFVQAFEAFVPVIEQSWENLTKEDVISDVNLGPATKGLGVTSGTVALQGDDTKLQQPMNTQPVGAGQTAAVSTDNPKAADLQTNVPPSELGELSDYMSEAVWSQSYIDNLPDSAFAYVSPGGSKDSEGKTTPRSLRHLPHHDSAGSVDLAHLANANARINQVKGGVPESVKSHLEGHKKDHKVGEFSETAEAKLAWSKKEALALNFGAIESALYAMHARFDALEPRIGFEMSRVFDETLKKNDLGHLLNTFGPRFVKMENRVEVLEECAAETRSALKTGAPTVNMAKERELNDKLRAVFTKPIDMSNLPPHVGTDYLHDRIKSERDRIYREIMAIR